ncbi:MAG: folylpolyglutamate synthase/dihydrofolate synthase family protein [Rhizobiaceae bacterium]|nr:folylpolyglutamate synthase/dihydrofolate synthase family protein [Rhizobiaceae bacterium]
MYPRTEALVEELLKNHPKGFDLSLGRITGLLEKLGNPHERIPPAIHVAGTNGKGSTIAFCRAILESAGYTVHVHTSPHLVNWGERYRLAGNLVDDNTLADAIERAAKANAGTPITVFEIMSAVMFILFSEHDADYSLVEVGLGGRADATNIIENPAICAIAPIGLDHQAYLGETIREIAFEKAGIIKHSTPVVVGPQQDEARDVIGEVAEKLQAPISFALQDFDYYRDATGFVYQDEDGLLDLPLPRLAGEHQLGNAALAISAIRKSGIEVSDEAFAKAMKHVVWPGRLEKLPAGEITTEIGTGADIWIDGGHNPDAGRVIATELKRQMVGDDQKLLMICGMINTKEPLGFFKPFSEMNTELVSIPVMMSDAGIEPENLAALAEEAGLQAQATDSLETAIEIARQKYESDPSLRILFCGSIYMLGEVLEKNGTPPR